MRDVKLDDMDLPFEERWENLTLANDFMFGKVFQDLDLCLELIRLILPELHIERITLHERQKAVHETLDTKGVRFDVYLHDDKGRIINIEIQIVNKDNIPRRTRAYHSIIDLEAISAGKIRRYQDMPEVIVIFICAFDLFGQGRHVYTFRNACAEDSRLTLDDGAKTIFLNTKGKADDISPRLKAFLELLNGKSSDDDFVKRLERRMSYARQNLYWRQEYMWNMFERNEYIDEGIAIGEERGIAIGEERGIAIGEERGMHTANIETAQRMRRAGMSDIEIHKLTLLPFEDIRNLLQ